MCVLIFGTSAPSAVVSAITTSPAYTLPTRSFSVAPPARSAFSPSAASTTARPEKSVAREPVVCPQPSAKVESTFGTKSDAASPVTSAANCWRMVSSPCPISV